jgi:hypothetical protein
MLGSLKAMIDYKGYKNKFSSQLAKDFVTATGVEAIKIEMAKVCFF